MLGFVMKTMLRFVFLRQLWIGAKMLVTGTYTGWQFNLSLAAPNYQQMWRSWQNSGLLHVHAQKDCRFAPRDQHKTRSHMTKGRLHGHRNAHQMHIAFNPPREVVWKRIETGYINIHNLCKVLPTMRTSVCSWLAACVILIVSVLLLQRRWGRLVFWRLRRVVQRGKIK